MKLLKIENNLGQFLSADGSYQDIEKISKEDLLRLVESVLDSSGELEPYDQTKIKNQAHQVIYKSIYENLQALESRKQEFIDKADRLYLEDYKKYTGDASQKT